MATPRETTNRGWLGETLRHPAGLLLTVMTLATALGLAIDYFYPVNETMNWFWTLCIPFGIFTLISALMWLWAPHTIRELERECGEFRAEKERLERKLATMASQLDDRQQRQQLIKQIEDYASRCRNMRNLETAQSLQAEIEPFLGEHFGPSTKQQFHEIIYRVTGKDDWPNMSPEAQRHACKELVGKAAAKFLDDLAENIREGG